MLVHVPLGPTRPAPSDLPYRFLLVIQTLCGLIAARAERERAAAPTILPTWSHLQRLARRFASLVGRVSLGDFAMAPARPRAASMPRPPPSPPRLSRGFAWLIWLAPEAAQLGGQVRALLADPEMAVLPAADKRAGQLLRPLCQMPGIEPCLDLAATLFERSALPLPAPPTADTTPATTAQTSAGPSLTPERQTQRVPKPKMVRRQAAHCGLSMGPSIQV